MKFESLCLSQNILRAIEDLNFTETTNIQSLAIPHIIEGKDLIGNSHTGSGKTAAFVIPILEMIDQGNNNIQVLILCPTRELTLQITDEIRKFSKYMENIGSLAIYGGEPIFKQIRDLKKRPKIIIGTPGRVMDHLRRGTLKTAGVNMLVLDEADEMLNMGFREDIETILKDIPKEHQTLLFSATIPKGILDISRNYMTDPKYIKVNNSTATTPKIEESYFDITGTSKNELLTRIIQLEKPSKSIVFCNTKIMTDTVASVLKGSDIKAESIHGDITQTARTDIMKRFKQGMFNVLVATDVAARGIDVDDIGIVFNYDIPIDREYYTHRIGRTARAGKEGKSYTFVSGRSQIRELNEIMNHTKTIIKKRKNPSNNEIQEKRVRDIFRAVEDNIANMDIQIYKKAIDSAFDKKYTHADIACALVKLLIDNNENEKSFRDAQAGTNYYNRLRKNSPAHIKR